jgi:hypothetical protein
MTPAMAADVTKRLWEMGDIVDVLEAWESWFFFKSALDGVVRDFLIESTVTEVSLTYTRLSRTDEQPFESSGQTIP